MTPFPSEPLRARIGPALRALRTTAGLEQKTLAKLLGVARSTYSYYESGATTPSAESLYLLARFYRIPMERFFEPAPKSARQRVHERRHP